MSNERRFGKPQYLGGEGFQREKPEYLYQSGRKIRIPSSKPSTIGYKTLSPETARQIADALRTMLR